MLDPIIILLTLLFLTISILSLLQKGPIFTTMYFLSNKEERKKLKTKKRYHFVGIVFLLVSIIFSMIFVEGKVDIPFIVEIRWGLILILCLYTIIRYAQLESIRMKEKKNEK